MLPPWFGLRVWQQDPLKRSACLIHRVPHGMNSGTLPRALTVHPPRCSVWFNGSSFDRGQPSVHASRRFSGVQ